MDTLSELLDAYPARGHLDVRCQWSGDWAYPHEAEGPGTVRFHAIVRGNAKLRVPGDVPIELHAGDIVALPSGDAHLLSHGARGAKAPPPPATVQPHPLLTWRRGSDEESELDMLCGRIDFGAAATTWLAALPRALHFRGSDGQPLVPLAPVVALLRHEVQQAAPGARSVVGQLSFALFVLALRHWWNDSDAVHGVFGLLKEPRLRPVAIAMLTRQHEVLSVEALAESCHMSRASFLRLFEQATQSSPALMLTQLRMDTAAIRLARGREPVGAIGETVGFQSESAFIRAFERHKGLTPAAYRRNIAMP